jgi:hypothetical protein
MTEDVHRALADLNARVAALEAWRVHQSDLLDEMINSGFTAADNGAGAPPPDASRTADLEDDTLTDWVHRTVANVIARPLRGEVKWCPLWWEHAEAVLRFTALHRAWTELAAEPGVGLSIWIRDHLDPCLRELMSPLGPFTDCAHNERFRTLNEHDPLPTLPTADPPDHR